MTRSDPRYKSLRCKIVTRAGGPDDTFKALPAVHVDFPGEMAMNINDKAPDFTLQDENGKDVALKDFLGKTVVLYFYPRADTPG
jgi:AhpC/TSA family protein